jgi:rod shape determining protein RodA
LAIAMNAPQHGERLLAGALTMVLFIYVFVNVGMVTGILPVVGVPLPFLSYGGTALLTLGIACGILMSISKYRPPQP